jgi:hypothetical protein
MKTFAQHVINFNRKLSFNGKLPDGVRIMNPFRDNNDILPITDAFYHKFYHDHRNRKCILGINPGRFGAGLTGIPFTDTKRLADYCGIHIETFQSHEPSSVFVYEMIERYGGVHAFYSDYYINSICPLGFLRKSDKGNWVNCNYYDYESLYQAMEGFMIDSLKTQIDFGLDTDTVYSLGKKNARYLERINQKEKLFGKIEVLDHPRYIVQYKSRYKEDFIQKYLEMLSKEI